jgi:hypothetical protein
LLKNCQERKRGNYEKKQKFLVLILPKMLKKSILQTARLFPEQPCGRNVSASDDCDMTVCLASF